MNIFCYNQNVSALLNEELIKRNLIYGEGITYNSLITPSSTYLNSREVQEICDDLYALWKFYKTLTELYLESVKGNLLEASSY